MKKKNEISRMKALKMMKETKGKFFTATFVKKDGTERKINCQWLKDQKKSELGYVLVRDAVLVKRDKKNCTRNVNMQTLKSLKCDGETYKIRN